VNVNQRVVVIPVRIWWHRLLDRGPLSPSVIVLVVGHPTTPPTKVAELPATMGAIEALYIFDEHK
jgi:hypothetical protein